jgi:hypothetical protein
MPPRKKANGRKKAQTEQEFANKFDSRLGRGRASKKEGHAVAGGLTKQTRNDEFINLVTGQKQTAKGWKNSPEIRGMRERAAAWREKQARRRRY